MNKKLFPWNQFWQALIIQQNESEILSSDPNPKKPYSSFRKSTSMNIAEQHAQDVAIGRQRLAPFLVKKNMWAVQYMNFDTKNLKWSQILILIKGMSKQNRWDFLSGNLVWLRSIVGVKSTFTSLTFKRFQPEELAPFLFPARGEKKKYFLYVEKLL